MIRFSQEKVLLLHQLIVAETGGSPELRDINLLDSALESVFQTFGGQELYPSKEEKGARLGYSLISNHAFVDGNKRIGMYVIKAANESIPVLQNMIGSFTMPQAKELTLVTYWGAAHSLKASDINDSFSCKGAI